MGHQDTKLTSMRPRLKELNDIPYIIHGIENLNNTHKNEIQKKYFRYSSTR